jgi:Protein of unknown function (DUF4230)
MLKKRLAILALLLALILGFGFILGIIVHRLAGSHTTRTYNTAIIIQQVKTLSQLVTVQYVMEKVVVLEDVKWIAGLGENRVLMVAHGNVKAGVDFGRLQPGDIKVSTKKIAIKLPPSQITDAYLDDKQTRVVERSTGLLRAFDKDLEQTARQNAVDDIRRAARNAGILKDAEERARAQLTNLFTQLGFDEIEFSR